MNFSETEWQQQNAAMRQARNLGPGGTQDMDLACYQLIARVLAERPQGDLPDEFARQTAALVPDDRRQRYWRESNIALLVVFGMLMASCMAAAHFVLGMKWDGVSKNLAAISQWLTYEPWLLTGVAGFGIVQWMIFRMRVRE
ncbi:MAG: hypothetical protein ABI769_04295 [Pseudomonadota bacterium]